MPRIKIPSPELIAELKGTSERVARTVRGDLRDDERTGTPAPDDIFAWVPTGGIPARVGLTAYGRLCNLYRVVDSNPLDDQIVFEATGQQTKFFNCEQLAVPGEIYVVTARLKSGHRYVLGWEPDSDSSDSDSSDSTPSDSDSSDSSNSNSSDSSDSDSSDSSDSDSSDSSDSDSSDSSDSDSSDSSGSDSSDSSDSTPSDSTPSDSDGSDASQSYDESDKSTAIVPAAWSPTGYVAWYTLECPNVRFDDLITEVDLTESETHVPIDFRYLDGCEPGEPVSAMVSSEDVPVMLAAKVVAGCVRVRMRGYEPGESVRVVIRLSGIRKGFAGLRFPNRTREQFVANEKFLRSAYPGAGR